MSGADHDQMERMRKYLTNMCTGWDVEQVQSIVGETLHDIVDPLVYDEAANLIEEHKLCGRDVVIVSASGEEIVEPDRRALGATQAMATRMVVEDGKYTGEIGFYAYGEDKARRSASSPRRGLRARALLRLQRLGHRRADARGGRPPERGQPRRALRKEPSSAAGRCWPSPGRCRCATASLHRRAPQSPPPRRLASALWSRAQ